jgi:replicative DNA helicase
MLERVPPHNEEAEQAFLGSLILQGDMLDEVGTKIQKNSFYFDKHEIIYQAILELAEEYRPVDLITLTNKLKEKSSLDKVGGSSYIAYLSTVVPTAANVVYYADIVEKNAILRELITTSTNIASKAFQGEAEVEYLLDESERMILDVAEKRQKEGFTEIKDALNVAIDNISKMAKSKGDVTGIPTYRDLDKYLLGLHGSDMLIVAARPGMGKTSFCLNLALKAAKEGYPVALFSLEMSADQLVTRMLSSESMIDQQKLRSGNISIDEIERMIKTAGEISKLPIYIDDSPGISVMEIRGKTRRLKAKHGLGLIIIDYLQLMQSHKKSENRQQEVSEISRSLKALARELDVPLMALSQLSRAVEQTADKKPALSHLRESGSLEQDSDCVMFIHRPEYYDEETEKKNIAEIIIAKHRHGPTGTVDLAFFAELTKFADLAQ